MSSRRAPAAEAAGRPSRLEWAPGVPKWEQLHQDLLRRIADDEFVDAFPGELDLTEDYGVSRHTVREALRRLREHGVLDSARGRATTVRPRPIEQQLGGLYSLFREVEARGHVQRSDVLACAMVTDARAASALGVPAETELFHLERLRRSDGEPLAHDRVWLLAEVGRPLLRSDFRRAALYDEMVRRSGVRPTGGRERIAAVVPTEAQRDLLELPPDTACFEIERLGQVRREPVEYRVSLVRADRYALVTEWTPDGLSLAAGATAPDA